MRPEAEASGYLGGGDNGKVKGRSKGEGNGNK
jgi:hypothetical protein